MLTEYRANGTEEAKKKRWKPGMQSTGGRDIPAPPPPGYCMSLKDFCPVGNENRTLLSCSVIKMGDPQL